MSDWKTMIIINIYFFPSNILRMFGYCQNIYIANSKMTWATVQIQINDEIETSGEVTNKKPTTKQTKGHKSSIIYYYYGNTWMAEHCTNWVQPNWCGTCNKKILNRSLSHEWSHDQ